MDAGLALALLSSDPAWFLLVDGSPQAVGAWLVFIVEEGAVFPFE